MVDVIFVTIVTNRISTASIIFLFKRVIPKHSLELNLCPLWNTLLSDLWLQTHFFRETSKGAISSSPMRLVGLCGPTRPLLVTAGGRRFVRTKPEEDAHHPHTLSLEP